MKLAVYARAELGGELTELESAELAGLGYRGERANEWVAGRLAAHRLGVADVLCDADGAPRAARGTISISHDDRWVAVATAEAGAVAVDVCSRVHAVRARAILDRLGLSGDPCLTWAALECALKLRRRGVWNLLDAHVEVEPHGDGARVRGVGDDVRVRWQACGDYVIAWGHEA